MGAKPRRNGKELMIKRAGGDQFVAREARNMRTVILNFISALRQAGLRISLSESMDALQAIAVAGVEQEILKEALAASLVKEEADRPAFDEIFTRFFMGPGRRRKGKLDQQTGAGEGQRTKEQGAQPQTRTQPAKK